jgi:hypothetical protein
LYMPRQIFAHFCNVICITIYILNIFELWVKIAQHYISARGKSGYAVWCHRAVVTEASALCFVRGLLHSCISSRGTRLYVGSVAVLRVYT